MIPSLQNKSQDETIADFDATFRRYNLTPPQKPTTSRKVVLGVRDNWVILPEEVKITQITADLGRPLGERYLLILSNLYARGLFRKKTTGQLGNFLSIHRDVLRKLGGENYPTLLKYGQTELHLVKSPKQFIRGKRTNEYMLNQKVFSLRTQQRYELTTKAAIRIRTEHADIRKEAFVRTGPVYQKIADSIDKLKFNYLAAFKYLASLPHGEARTHRENVLEQLILDSPSWSLDKQGRNYTVMVTVPRDIRCFFSYGNQPLHVIDISSSQPLLHSLLYSANSSEKTRYLSIVQTGKFWDFMNDAAGKPYNLRNADQKAELKEMTYQQVFYSRPATTKSVTKMLTSIFRREFPVLWSEIEARKHQEKFKPAGPLARAMQLTEAEAVCGAIELLIGKPYPLISIHDAIVTTKDGIADVNSALKQSFSTADLNPHLVTKKLTV